MAFHNSARTVAARMPVPTSSAPLIRTSSRPVASAPAVCARCFSRQLRPARLPQPVSAARSSARALPIPQLRERPSRRAYHSSDNPPPPGPFSAAEQDILTAAYAEVPEHGFTLEAIAIGARKAGYLDISAAVLPDGVFSLVRWHLVTQRQRLAERAAQIFGEEGSGPRENMSLGARVEALMWERLMGNRAVAGRWQEALAIMAQPTYVPASLKELAALADDIWYLAGDVSVDSTWYTKRASVSVIYASTELFMTTDRSPKFQETRNFLRRRVAEINEFGTTLRSIGQWVSFTANAGLNLLRSKGARV